MEDRIEAFGGPVLRDLRGTTANASTALTSSNSAYHFHIDPPDVEDGGAGVREPRRPRSPLLPGEMALSLPA